MRQDGEPSVDQLLQSIKKVLARDSRPAAPEQGEGPQQGEMHGQAPAQDPYSAPQETPGQPAFRSEPANEEEAGDLHDLDRQFAGPDTALPLAGPAEGLPDGVGRPDENMPGEDLIEDEADGEAAQPGEADGDTAVARAPDAGEPLLSAEVAGSIQRSLDALAMLADPQSPDSPNLPGGASLDVTVRELLRPMLAQWLETHLPALVERELKAELARIAGGNPR